LEALERVYRDVASVCVKFLFCVFFIVTLALKLHAYPVRNGLDSLCPKSLVEFRIDPYVSGAHRLPGEFHNRFDGPRGTLFERTAMHKLVQVDRVLASHDVLESRALGGFPLFCSGHVLRMSMSVS